MAPELAWPAVCRFCSLAALRLRANNFESCFLLILRVALPNGGGGAAPVFSSCDLFYSVLMSASQVCRATGSRFHISLHNMAGLREELSAILCQFPDSGGKRAFADPVTIRPHPPSPDAKHNSQAGV